MSQGLPNPEFMQEKVQKLDFLWCPMMKKTSTHFSDSTHQECMIFARIGHGPCYYHWNDIFAGVYSREFKPALLIRKSTFWKKVTVYKDWKQSETECMCF